MEPWMIASRLAECQCSHAAMKNNSLDLVESFLILLTPYHSLFSFPWHSVFQLRAVRLSTEHTHTHTHTDTRTHKYTADFPWTCARSEKPTYPDVHSLQHGLNNLSETKLCSMTNKRLPGRQMSTDWARKRVVGGHGLFMIPFCDSQCKRDKNLDGVRCLGFTSFTEETEVRKQGLLLAGSE